MGCEKTPTDGENNGSRQEQIPWPSLADSPWPMFHHDPQATGRSQYVGPQLGRVKWAFDLSPGYTQGSVAIGPDSTIYFASSRDFAEDDTTFDHPLTYLYAVDREGNLKWRFRLLDPSSGVQVPEVFDAPVISADGTLFISSGDNFIYAINPDGTLKWKYDTQIPLQGVWFTGPNIDLTGAIYAPGGWRALFSLTSEGSLRWTKEFEQGVTSVAISPDGESVYVSGFRTTAIDLSGNQLWEYPGGRAVTIDNDGNIYTFSKEDTVVRCLTPSGNLKWQYSYGKEVGKDYDRTIASMIDSDGNFYFTGSDPTPFELVSLDHEGNLRWRFELEGGPVGTNLISDIEGTIYVGMYGGQVLYAITQNGELKWQLSLPVIFHGSPAIDRDGTMYVCTYRGDSIVYAIE